MTEPHCPPIRLPAHELLELTDALLEWRGMLYARMARRGVSTPGLRRRHDAYTHEDGYDRSQLDVSPGVYTGE